MNGVEKLRKQLEQQRARHALSVMARDMARSKIRFLVFAGLAMWCLGIWAWTMEHFVYATWPVAEGHVIELRPYTKIDDGERELAYDFTIEYPWNGQKLLLAKKDFSGRPKFKIGDPMPIQVNIENLEKSRLNDGGLDIFLWTAFICGAFLMFIGSFGYRKKSKPRAEPPAPQQAVRRAPTISDSNAERR